MNILIVDDDMDLCETLKEEVEDMGHQVEYVLTGTEAIQQFENHQEWHLILVDIKLSSSMTGLDVIEEVRKKSPRTTVLAMSGYVEVDFRQKAEKLGVKYYLNKPDDLQPEILRKKIEACLTT